jgi:hypothetical protein
MGKGFRATKTPTVSACSVLACARAVLNPAGLDPACAGKGEG